MSENNELSEMWATVELMGHGQTAGRISRPTEMGGLMRVDVPEGDGYRTEFYGMSAIYAIKVTSEEIARAFVQPMERIYSYDAPIVTRDEHQAVVMQLERQRHSLEREVVELKNRLVAVRALEAPKPQDDEEQVPF